jgi:protein TonB
LAIYIDEQGDVNEVEVVSSPGLASLETEAVKTAFKCKFKPAVKDGEPVATWYSIVMEFRL